MAPVHLKAGALGNKRDLWVSPQHRMFISGWKAEMFFGKPEVLASAVSLQNDLSIRQVPTKEVEYFHLLFDQHEIIFAEGALAESFHPNATSLSPLDQNAKQEILALFPELAYGAIARPTIDFCEAQLIADQAI